jgi:hypothetical protein
VAIDAERVLLGDSARVVPRVESIFYFIKKSDVAIAFLCDVLYIASTLEKRVRSLINQSYEGGDMVHQSVPKIAEAATDVERVLLGDIERVLRRIESTF